MLKKLISNIFMGFSQSTPKKSKQSQDTQPKEYSQYDNISFKEGFCLTNLPICIFFQGDRSFTFLLDTGSDDNVIDSNILSEMKHKMSEEVGSVMGIDGVSTPTGICNIGLDYKSSTYFSDFLVKDMGKTFAEVKKRTGVTLNGILGSKFFRMFKFVIDFDVLIAYSRLTLKK